MTEPVAGQPEQDAPVQTPANGSDAEPEQEPEETVEYTFELETAVPEIAPLADFGQSDSSTLNESEKILYNSIREKIEDIARNGGSSVFELTGEDIPTLSGADSDEVQQAFNEAVNLDRLLGCLLVDCPQDLFWFDKTDGLSLSAKFSGNQSEMHLASITVTMKVAEAYQNGSDTEVQVKDSATAIQNAQNIAAEIKNSGGTTDEKLEAILQKICELVSYNDEAAAAPSYDMNAWGIIWVFDDDPETKVVCEGYAKAFQYLCDQVFDSSELTCYTVTGTMGGGTGEGPHMWNIVSKNGLNYLVDVTNCDGNSVGNPDKLFMQLLHGNAGEDGSFTYDGDTQTYTARIDSRNQVTYQYDADTTALYPESILTLSAEGDPEIPTPGDYTIAPDSASLSAVYGDAAVSISFTVTQDGGSEPVGGTAKLLYGETVLAETAVTSGAGSFSYNTTEKKVPVGEQSLTIRYYTAEDSETEAASTAVSLTLSPKQLTATGLTAVDKFFDGTTAIEVNGPGTLSGIESGDDVALADLAGTVETANAGTGKPVTVTASLTGDQAGYYTFTSPADVTVSISAADVTVEVQVDTEAAVGETVKVTAIIPNAIDGFDAEGTMELFVDDQSAGSKPVSGNQAEFDWTAQLGEHTFKAKFTPDGQGNYNAAESASVSCTGKSGSTVTPSADLTVIYGESRDISVTVLDSTKAPIITGQVEFRSGDVSLGTAAPDGSGVAKITFDSTGKLLSIGSHTITAIYTPASEDIKGSEAEFQLTLNTKAVDAADVTAADKVFDGTTDGITVTGNVTGTFGADEVRFEGTGTVADANAGTDKPVTVTGALTGKDAGYYTLSGQPAGVTVNITPAPVTVSLELPQTAVSAGETVTITAGISGTVPGFDAAGTMELFVNGASAGSQTVSGNQAQFSWLAAKGEYTFQAKFTPAENGNYSAADSAEEHYSITKELQEPIVIEAVPEKTVGEPAFNLTVSGGSTEADFTYAVTSGDAVTVDSTGKVTIVKEGTAVITVSKAGDETYNPASAAVTITVKAPVTDLIPDGDITGKTLLAKVPSAEDQTALSNQIGGAFASQFKDMTAVTMDIVLIDNATGLPVTSLGQPLTFCIDYPAAVGSNYGDYEFVILHIPTTGSAQIVPHTVTAKGLQITVDSLSPFAVGYRLKSTTPGHTTSSSSGSSYTERQEAFWDEVKDLIRDAEPGDTIKVNARSYDRMPYSVMRVLGEQDDLLLHITWNDGEDIWITSDFAANEPQRVYYPLEELVDMDLTEQPEEQGTGTPGKVNPPTGGILEISAPVPYSEAVHNTGKTADASLARPSENAHAAEETDTAKPESGNSLALTAAAIVVLAAGGAGFWFWKKKYQD